MTSHKYINISLSIALLLSLSFSSATHATEASDTLIKTYEKAGAGPFSAQSGEALWTQNSNGESCTSCHSDSVTKTGKHKKTGKTIQAMAPSVNPERLSDTKKIEKWLLRNCKWTFKRECSTQEKGDILLWLSQQ